MIASGGMTFDDIVCSSEDEMSIIFGNKHSVRSDTSSTDSLDEDSNTFAKAKESGSTMPVIRDQDILNKRELVMKEIKNNLIYSSDSERESEINRELDAYYYGVTPPREIRRSKQKFKDFKFSSNWNQMGGKIGGKKSNDKKCGMKNGDPVMGNTNSQFTFNWQKDRDNKRKEKEDMDNFNTNNLQETFLPPQRSSKLVRVSSSKNLRSISHQKASNSVQWEKPVVTPSVLTKAIHLNVKRMNKDASETRVHFYKTFSLLVKLGGRPVNNSNQIDENEQIDDEHWQVRF